MTRPAREIINAAIEPTAEKDVDAAWAAEVQRRSREIKQGTIRPIPWEEVKSHARKRVRGRT